MAPPSSRPGSSARPSSSGVPYLHGSANGKPTGAGAAPAKMAPGTPRREQSHRQEKAVQDPGLKDYVGSRAVFFLGCLLAIARFGRWYCTPRLAGCPALVVSLFTLRRTGHCVCELDGVCTARPYIHAMHALPGLHMHPPIRPVAWWPAAGSLFWMKRWLREREAGRLGMEMGGQAPDFRPYGRPDCEK